MAVRLLPVLRQDIIDTLVHAGRDQTSATVIAELVVRDPEGTAPLPPPVEQPGLYDMFERILADPGISAQEMQPPVPGWLRPGLPLLDALRHEPYRVTRVVEPDFYVAERPTTGELGPYLISNLHRDWISPLYFECDDCRRKPGSPTLCSSCLERRTQESRTGECAFPPLCLTSYAGGYLDFCVLLTIRERDSSARGLQPPKRPAARPSRFKREEPL
jgi:hypothetical protein